MAFCCPSNSISCRESGSIVRYGHYYRKSDRKWIQRLKCTLCLKHFSQASNSPCFGQNKRHLNYQILKLLVSGCSQRRIAWLLKTRRLTVARKLAFLGLQARHFNVSHRLKFQQVSELQFDDLETIEHTKLKPLSVTLAVEKHSRRILGFEVSRMPAKGLLAKRARKKYGPRVDERTQGRERLFRRIKPHILPTANIESDENPHYPEVLRSHLPHCRHQTFKGQRGCVAGQGELKAVKFDPLFSLNHTCAMLRANINRLFRKTWCTTKRLQPLIDHIEIYVMFHNRVLIN